MNSERYQVQEVLNREAATQYVRSVLDIKDTSKFSAKEFNSDFESSTFVVTCAVDKKEFEGLTCKQSCKLVQPEEVQIKIVNADKGILQTSISGYPPILGGGNQFTVALCCQKVFNIQATFVPMETASLTSTPLAMFPVDKSPAEKASVSSPSLTKK